VLGNHINVLRLSLNDVVLQFLDKLVHKLGCGVTHAVVFSEHHVHDRDYQLHGRSLSELLDADFNISHTNLAYGVFFISESFDHDRDEGG
jgi:hypothetical protein